MHPFSQLNAECEAYKECARAKIDKLWLDIEYWHDKVCANDEQRASVKKADPGACC